MSFQWKKATITAKELTIADDDRIGSLMARLPELDGNTTTRYRFAEFMIGADISGDAPLPLVSATSSDADLQQSFEAWGALPRTFGRKWQAELNQAESAPNS